MSMYFDEREAHRLIVAISTNVRYIENLINSDKFNPVADYEDRFTKLYDYIDRLGGIITLPRKPTAPWHTMQPED